MQGRTKIELYRIPAEFFDKIITWDTEPISVTFNVK
jgi:hypothetical protein